MKMCSSSLNIREKLKVKTTRIDYSFTKTAKIRRLNIKVLVVKQDLPREMHMYLEICAEFS